MSDYQVRRATVEDLPALRRLWQAAGLNAPELEKRLTEFQVVESPAGEPVGAVAIQITGKHARLHSEVFASGDQADDFRARLWKRLNAVAVNHGLVRLWTQERAPYWHQNGFVPAAGEALQKLPPAFAGLAGDWFTRQLREETAAPPSVEHEFELFKQAQMEERAQIMKQARAVKVLAGIVSVILLVIIVVAMAVYFKRQPRTRLPGVVTPPAATNPAPTTPAPEPKP
jgi:N-acetylglutamate synthase-like GNAT family acetyltransferase